MNRVKGIAKTLTASLLCSLFATLVWITPAFAADLLIPNYSFESGTTSWTQKYGTGGISSSTTQTYTGTKSLKIVDTTSSDAVGTESDYLPALAGTTYVSYARAYIDSGAADLYVRFWNSSKSYLGAAYSTKSTPVSDWTYLKTTGVAPAGTAYVTVLLYSGGANVGTTYWDDVFVTKSLMNVGTQITSSSIHSATFGKDGSNNDTIYAVVDGATGIDARLASINVDTLSTSTYALSGAAGGWAVTKATDGKIYAGTYNNGKLFQYTPGASSVVDLGQAGGQPFLWSLAPGPSGSVFIGSFPNSKLMKYTPESGFTQLGSSPLVGSEQYVRSVAYDPTNNIVYAGVGSHAHLIKYNVSTGVSTSVLPASYSSEQFVYNLDIEGGKLFARVLPSYKTIVFDITGGVVTKEAEIDKVTSSLVSEVSGGLVYFVKDNVLHTYNIASKTYTSLGVSFLNAQDFKLIQLADQTNYPGYTLVGIANNLGKIQVAKYNIQNGTVTNAYVSGVSATPTILQNLVKGPDNKIYTGGFLTGGTGIYTSMRSDEITIERGVGQSESMAFLNGKLYTGVYPEAFIYEYDPANPWSIGSNPVKLFDLKADKQDRPGTMVSAEGKLFIGSVPSYGELGGALTIYDPSTGTYTVNRNIVYHQSIIALAYKSGYIYGGTSISGGLGVAPSETSAKLLKYNISTGTSTAINLPVSGLAAITAVTVGPDNNIWMMAEGYLFIYNPTTGTFVYNSNIFPTVTYGPTASSGIVLDASLVNGKDGYVYGVIKGTYFFKIHPTTKAVTTIESTANSKVRLIEDEFRNLYYISGTDIFRYAF
ncbi:hypothetical protein [Paenibacillus nasutitermitis]|uniref:CBM-cenC domain-containing protein n=1 Tax=Paenibacillus nasutitermitis TaxID=1652958 RepID=A0A916Z9L4_9BACL|nr:hypothetical protein [Paenibacillus nasutitermitis]GGD82545.1 hypothetical protein GCM10010911_45870 [Paenibacillus nasutitermitis]